MAPEKHLMMQPLQIVKVDAWRVYVPLLKEWATSPEYGPHTRGPDRLILRIEDADGHCGWGEGTTSLSGEKLKACLHHWMTAEGGCAAPSACWNLHPEPTYWHEPGQSSRYAPTLGSLAHRIRHPLQTTVETAWLDLLARRAGVPLHFLFGGAWRDRVPVDYWMGRVTPEHARQCVARARSLGFTGVKLKTTLQDDNIGRLEAIHAECGPDWHVTVDPNGRFYRLDDALPLILKMDAIGNMQILEDPFPRFHLPEFAALRPRLKARLVVHIDPPESLHTVIQSGAAGGFNLDNHPVGLFGWRMLAAAADTANLPVWHGSGLDLGIATATQLHLCAATPNCQLPGDQSGPWLRAASLVKEAFSVNEGKVLVPEGPGHGVSFDPDAAEEYCLERFTLET